MRVCSGRFFYRELNPRLWFNVWTPLSETNTNMTVLLLLRRYHFDLYISFQLHAIACFFLLLCPLWDQMAFLLHYGGRQLHLVSCSDTTGVGLALAFIYLLLRTCCLYYAIHFESASCMFIALSYIARSSMNC